MSWKKILGISLLLFSGPFLFATELNKKDFEVQESNDKGFSISGDVRTELQIQKNKRDLDLEVNLQFEHSTDRTFSVVKFKFDNDMGTDGGTFNKIFLSKAFIGLHLLEGVCNNLYLEIGRQPFGDIFDSKAQFNTSFDGANIHYKRLIPIGIIYVKQGAFSLNKSLKKIGSATEVGLLEIADTGAYIKDSFTYWNGAYQINQLTIGYKCLPEAINRALHIYAAGLMNIENQKKGYYVGFKLGETKIKGDYSFEINYQWLEKRALYRKDAAGLGANIKGINGEFCYNLTDHISLYQCIKWKKKILKTEKTNDDWLYEIELRHSF